MHSIDTRFESFVDDVIDASRKAPVLVDFWAPWCGPCQMLTPLLEKLAAEYEGAFCLAKANIDEQQQLAMQYAVRSVPTVKLFKNGEVVDEFLGAQSESQIRAMLDRHIERESDKAMNRAYAAYKKGDVDALQNMIEIANRDPGNHRIRLQLADILIQEKRYDEAKEVLEALPHDIRQTPEVAGMLGRLEFFEFAREAPDISTLENRIRENPRNSEARYQLSAIYITQAEYEKAMHQLLEILKRDRSYGDDAARKALLRIFDMLGGGGELVQRYRHKMAAALH